MPTSPPDDAPATRDSYSPCDLKALPRSSSTAEDLEEWSISQHEQWTPHYRYRFVCCKWDYKAVLCEGYTWRQVRALERLFTDACQKARPTESSWTRPLFLAERITPPIRSRRTIGDIAFVQHDTNHKDYPDGSSSWTSRRVVGVVEAVSDKGVVTRVRGFDGTLYENPTVKRSYCRDDILFEDFTAHLQAEMQKLADAARIYDFLSSDRRITEALYRYARAEVQQTAVDVDLAVRCIRTIELPGNRPCPDIEPSVLRHQVDAVLAGTGQRPAA